MLGRLALSKIHICSTDCSCGWGGRRRNETVCCIAYPCTYIYCYHRLCIGTTRVSCTHTLLVWWMSSKITCCINWYHTWLILIPGLHNSHVEARLVRESDSAFIWYQTCLYRVWLIQEFLYVYCSTKLAIFQAPLWLMRYVRYAAYTQHRLIHKSLL